jgi:hypothetical protein
LLRRDKSTKTPASESVQNGSLSKPATGPGENRPLALKPGQHRKLDMNK